MQRTAWIGLAGYLLLLAGPAHAAMSVYGTPQTVKCYEYAEAGLLFTDPCDEALSENLMSSRDRIATLVNRGIIYNLKGKYDLAIADFEAALAEDSSVGEAYLSRGNSRFMQRRFEDALSDYTRAIDLGIKRMEAAHYNRALALAALGRIPEARTELEAALAIDPDFTEARDRLAYLKRVKTN